MSCWWEPKGAILSIPFSHYSGLVWIILCYRSAHSFIRHQNDDNRWAIICETNRNFTARRKLSSNGSGLFLPTFCSKLLKLNELFFWDLTSLQVQPHILLNVFIYVLIRTPRFMMRSFLAFSLFVRLFIICIFFFFWVGKNIKFGCCHAHDFNLCMFRIEYIPYYYEFVCRLNWTRFHIV